jgi:hypothetical protein
MHACTFVNIHVRHIGDDIDKSTQTNEDVLQLQRSKYWIVSKSEMIMDIFMNTSKEILNTYPFIITKHIRWTISTKIPDCEDFAMMISDSSRLSSISYIKIAIIVTVLYRSVI